MRIVNAWHLFRLRLYANMSFNNWRKIKPKSNLGRSLLIYHFDFGLWNSCSCGYSALDLHDKMKTKIQLKRWSGEKKENRKIYNLGIDNSTNIQSMLIK